MTVPLSDGDLSAAFYAEQVTIQAREAARVPLGVMGVTGVMAFGAWPHLHPLVPILWFLAVSGLLYWRFLITKTFLAKGISPGEMGKWWLRFGIMNGVVMGLGVALLMQGYSLQWQAIATIFLLALVAGAVAATALSLKHFKAYTVPVIAFLAIGWALFGKTDPKAVSFLIAALCPAYLLVFTAFVRDSEASAKIGFNMRFENARLLEQLQDKQGEVVKERDIAEKASLAKSRFLASASHDLRQPLQTISMYNAALSLQTLNESSKELVARAGIAISSLTSLLNALLDVSQLDTASIKANIVVVSLDKLVSRIEGEFRDIALNNGIRFEVHISSNLHVFADPILLERILRNLLDNAFKHGAKSLVVLQARVVERQKIEMEIFDDGHGIPISEMEAIFEEFYQLKNPERDRAQGLGLGLPIVRRLCELIGGTCAVDSSPSATRFIVTLHQTMPELGPLESSLPAPSQTTNLEGKWILILDDEAEVRSSLAALLLGWGCQVDTTGEINEATAFLASHSYLVLLIDFRLRNDWTGLRFISENKVLLENVATIMLTGDASEEVAKQAEAFDVPVVRKPIGAAELKRILEDIANP